MQKQIITLLAVLVLVSSCKQKEEHGEVSLVTFPLRGEVVSIDTAKMRVTIAHEEIPNYMMAMTMPFKVRDRNLLVDLEPGDSVQATLAVSRTESWLDALSILGKGEHPATQPVSDVRFNKLLKIGDRFPDETLINHDGKTIRFSHFRGKVVAITFIYTRCPIPDYCIRMSDYFARIQRSLKKEGMLDGKWHLITISFDPEFDTPKVLKEYGKNYGADFTTWDFATNDRATVMRVTSGLDLIVEDDEGGLIAHNLRTVILDRDGNLAEIIKDNDWKPDQVVSEIRKLATL